MKTILYTVITAIILTYLLNIAIGKNERVECQKWHEYSHTYADFEYTDWQREQCNIIPDTNIPFRNDQQKVIYYGEITLNV